MQDSLKVTFLVSLRFNGDTEGRLNNRSYIHKLYTMKIAEDELTDCALRSVCRKTHRWAELGAQIWGHPPYTTRIGEPAVVASAPICDRVIGLYHVYHH